MTPIVKRTKIIATLGPASSSLDIILKMCQLGANVFRLNFSHGTHNIHKQNIDFIRQAEKKVGHPIGILADLQGPKFRIGLFEKDKIMLKTGQKFTLDLNIDAPGNDTRVAFPHKEVYPHVKKGSKLLLDDGKIELRVTEATKTAIHTTVSVSGRLSSHKGVNLPEDTIPGSALTEKDLKDLAFILKQDVDFIALSFVQTQDDIITLKKHVKDKAKIVAKIEKPQAITNFAQILKETDAIMVARGDLGVEFPPEKVPALQKHIVKECRAQGIPVIVATQMLESMVEAPTPTRAETSDVANAVYDGADAVMLSAESAAGNHPLEAVDMMTKVIQSVENDENYRQFKSLIAPAYKDTITSQVTFASDILIKQLQAKAIVSYTTSGLTALRQSQTRPECPILALTESISVSRMLTLSWGVLPYYLKQTVSNFEALTEKAHALVKEKKLATKGDRYVTTFGAPFGKPGTTNTIHANSVK